MPLESDQFSSGKVPPTSEPEPAAATQSAEDDTRDRTGPAAIRHLQEQLQELGEFVGLYLSARLDALGVSVRRVVVLAAMGLLGFAIAAAILVASAVIGVLGIAELVAHALGDRMWAGYLITGFGLLLLMTLALWVAVSRFTKTFRERTVRRYERRRQEQQARFGRDAREPAAAERRAPGA